MYGEISEKNLIQHEFIGLHTSIITTPCKSLENITGMIVDETKNTFKIEHISQDSRKTITVQKHKTIFRVALPENNIDSQKKTIDIDGTVLTKRPENRIKKLAKLANKMNKNYN